MRKRQELSDPSSCMSRARDDEWTFVLLGRDVTAPDTIRDWVLRRIDKGKNRRDDPQVAESLRVAIEIENDLGILESLRFRVISEGFRGALVRICFFNLSGYCDCRFAVPFGPHLAGDIIVVPVQDLWPSDRKDDPGQIG